MDADGPSGFLVVGAGFLGARAAAMTARGCRLVAVHDNHAAAAQTVARHHGVRVVNDYNAALAWDEIDAVIIATPHGDHFEQARLALEAGKHVLCEKPLTVRPDEARRLALRADALGLRLATGLNHRFYPPIQDALGMVADWTIGRVESVRAEIGHKASAEFLASWHTDAARSGGGTLMDNGPHACDLVRRFLGEVVAAEGTVGDTIGLPEGCESEATVRFRDHDRGVAEVRSSWTQPTGYLTIEVQGTEGRLHVETAPWKLTGVLATGRRVHKRYLAERFAERRFRGLFGCERSLVREIEAFVSPAKDERPEATGWDGCRVTEMIDAVYRVRPAIGRRGRARADARLACPRPGLGARPGAVGDDGRRPADPDLSRDRRLGRGDRDRSGLVRRDDRHAGRIGPPRGGSGRVDRGGPTRRRARVRPGVRRRAAVGPGHRRCPGAAPRPGDRLRRHRPGRPRQRLAGAAGGDPA